MPEEEKGFLGEYCIRFGKLAVDMGFITPDQLCRAMEIQIKEDTGNRPHKIIGQILFEQGWMTPPQIDRVLNRLFEGRRTGEGA